MHPRTVVLVGAGQFQQRTGDPAVALEPMAMMAAAAELAAEDAGTTKLLAQIDSIRVVKGSWPYRDPAGSSPGALGPSPARPC